MKTRILSAIIALPLVLIPIYFGGLPMYSIILLAMIIGLMEFHRAFQINSPFIYGIEIAGAFLQLLVIRLDFYSFLFAPLILVVFILLGYYMVKYPKYPMDKLFVSMFSFVYLIIFTSHIVLIRENLQKGNYFIWLILLIAFGSDTCAYFSGVTLGKHKLAPKLSPKKTIEGSIGAIIGTSLITLAFGFYMFNNGIEKNLVNILFFVIMGFFGSMVSQLGDMAASAMKRVVGIKDFGKLLPGHGGIIDRLDSIIFVAPFVYYMTVLILEV